MLIQGPCSSYYLALAGLGPVRFFGTFFPTKIITFASRDDVNAVPIAIHRLHDTNIPKSVTSFITKARPSRETGVAGSTGSSSTGISRRRDNFTLGFTPGTVFSTDKSSTYYNAGPGGWSVRGSASAYKEVPSQDIQAALNYRDVPDDSTSSHVTQCDVRSYLTSSGTQYSSVSTV